MQARLVLGWTLLVLSVMPWVLVPLLFDAGPSMSEAFSIGAAVLIPGEVSGFFALLILGREAVSSAFERVRIRQRGKSARHFQKGSRP